MAEFAGLAGSVRHAARPSPTRLVVDLVPHPGLADGVRDLVRRETACCSFFSFTVWEAPEALVLEVVVPAEQAAVLDGLGRLLTGRTSAA